jgi:hypothetical protein
MRFGTSTCPEDGLGIGDGHEVGSATFNSQHRVFVRRDRDNEIVVGPDTKLRRTMSERANEMPAAPEEGEPIVAGVNRLAFLAVGRQVVAKSRRRDYAL